MFRFRFAVSLLALIPAVVGCGSDPVGEDISDPTRVPLRPVEMAANPGQGLADETDPDRNQDAAVDEDSEDEPIVSISDADRAETDVPMDVERQPYGARCDSHDVCAEGLCVQGQCSHSCDVDTANPCQKEKAFCLPYLAAEDTVDFACSGTVDTGADPDDAIVAPGDSLRRNLSPLSDADMFTLDLDRTGTYLYAVVPGPGIDVALDVYNAFGEMIGTFDESGAGEVEAGFTAAQSSDSGWLFLVVRNVGRTSGPYALIVEHQ